MCRMQGAMGLLVKVIMFYILIQLHTVVMYVDASRESNPYPGVYITTAPPVEPMVINLNGNNPSLKKADSTLKYVFVVARGGLRTGLFTPYPKDPAYDDFKKSGGIGEGELTKDGERLMTAVGKALNSRYKKLLGSENTKKKVTAQKSKRTKNSAKLMADSLFSSPQAVDTNTDSMDKYYVLNDKNQNTCRSYYKLIKSKRFSNWHILDKTRNAMHLSKCIKLTGDSMISDKLELMRATDNIEMAIYNNKITIGQLAKNVGLSVDQILVLIDEKYIDTRSFVYRMSNDLLPYFSGPLLHEMFKEFDGCKGNCKGFHLHVTHSSVLTAFMAGLHVSSIAAFPGAAVMVELHKDNMVKLFVYTPVSIRYKYKPPGSLYEATDGSWVTSAMGDLCKGWNPGNGQGEVSHYKGKPPSCPLSFFRKNTCSPLSPADWSAKCDK